MAMTAAELDNLNKVVNNLRNAWKSMTNDQRNMVITMIDLVVASETMTETGSNDEIASFYLYFLVISSR